MCKILYCCALLFFVNTYVFSQTTFNKTQSIALPQSGGQAPYNIASGLIDEDAFYDIVVSTTIGGTVYWLKNDGTGDFELQNTPIGLIMLEVLQLQILTVMALMMWYQHHQMMEP
jgi:hypothetical protein